MEIENKMRHQDTTKDSFKEMLELCENRSSIYWFLSEFYNKKPTQEFIVKIKKSLDKLADVEDEIEELKELRIIKDYVDKINDDSLLDLQVAFTRLFRGIKKGYGPPPPYESVYRGENQVYGIFTEKVMKFYGSCGFGVIDNEVGPQDHITAELKFLSMLCFKEKEAWEESKYDLLKFWLKKEKDFIDQHLGRWLSDFSNAVVSYEHPFYSAVVRLTEGWVSMDREFLSELEDNLFTDDKENGPEEKL